MSDMLKSILTTQGSKPEIKDGRRDEHIDDAYAMPLSEIKLRPHGDKRPLDLVELIERAASIDAVGLIEPIVVDADARLIAGLHRYESFRLLNLENDEERLAHLNQLALELGAKVSQEIKDRVTSLGKSFKDHHANGVIPTYIRKDLDWEKDKKGCEVVEGAENHQRHNKTDLDPVFKTIKNLQERGFEVMGRGKPKVGQKSLTQGLVQAYGCTDRQALRWANQFIKSEEDPKSTMSIKDKKESKIEKKHIEEFKKISGFIEINESKLTPEVARAGLAVLQDRIKQLKRYLAKA